MLLRLDANSTRPSRFLMQFAFSFPYVCLPDSGDWLWLLAADSPAFRWSDVFPTELTARTPASDRPTIIESVPVEWRQSEPSASRPNGK